MKNSAPLLIGTAGWNIARSYAHCFSKQGTHLERYAQMLNAVEINSSFYRPHQRQTYERWAASVPRRFRFSVKLPRAITHESRLHGCEAALDRFLSQVEGLGPTLGILLVQLPPSLRYDAHIASKFLAALRRRSSAGIACEPRHASWFGVEAERLLCDHAIARVAADPAPVPIAGEPGAWDRMVYYRLHGSPKIYYSNYDKGYLACLKDRLDGHTRAGRAAWCIFDNTAEFAALGNALTLTKAQAAFAGFSTGSAFAEA